MSLHLSDESLDRLQAARERLTGRASQPPPPARPKPAKPKPAKAKAVPPQDLPEGSVVLSAQEWLAVTHMMATHPQTRDVF